MRYIFYALAYGLLEWLGSYVGKDIIGILFVLTMSFAYVACALILLVGILRKI